MANNKIFLSQEKKDHSLLFISVRIHLPPIRHQGMFVTTLWERLLLLASKKAKVQSQVVAHPNQSPIC